VYLSTKFSVTANTRYISQNPVPRRKKPSALRHAAELRQVRLETREEVGGIHADQADEHAAHRGIADLEEDDDPKDRDEEERDGHSHVDTRVGAAQPVPPDREPVHAIRGERQRRHVERGRPERTEQGQAEEQVGTGNELHETGHPDAPHAGGEVNAVIAGRIAEKLLRAIDKIASPETHETDGKGREGRLGQADQ
jgi:hypothetical protein